MKNIYLASNKDCCRNLFYLCNQAMINQAELKKILDEKVSLWLSGENHGWPVVTRSSPALSEMQNQEYY